MFGHREESRCPFLTVAQSNGNDYLCTDNTIIINGIAKLIVKDTEVNVLKVNGEDYICITDMLRAKDGDFFITDWLRNRNTLEFIGI